MPFLSPSVTKCRREGKAAADEYWRESRGDMRSFAENQHTRRAYHGNGSAMPIITISHSMAMISFIMLNVLARR